MLEVDKDYPLVGGGTGRVALADGANFWLELEVPRRARTKQKYLYHADGTRGGATEMFPAPDVEPSAVGEVEAPWE